MFLIIFFNKWRSCRFMIEPSSRYADLLPQNKTQEKIYLKPSKEQKSTSKNVHLLVFFSKT